MGYVTEDETQAFRITQGETYGIYCSEAEDTAVKVAAANLAADIRAICGADGTVTSKKSNAKIILETKRLSHKEEFEIRERDGMLFISGSDRRGTVYGIYDFCQNAGVSPWCWFGDVPPKTARCISVEKEFHKSSFPSIEYRGIFLNDEEELAAWAEGCLGEKGIGLNAYEKIFELILRLKGNYIWPAMHTGAFNHVKGAGKLAHDMGIIVGTSHCDMLLRSNQNEWEPWIQQKGYSDLQYDYSIEGHNRERLREYWRESVEANRDYEVSYTVGMRGIHDSGFICTHAGTDDQKRALLEQVIADQRDIIRNATGKESSLQIFVPYKEVLQLYDEGLTVPEDVTLIWTNDNYGNVRRYPSEAERRRDGGNGIYYHVSYWAAPARSYLFIGSTPLAQIKNELRKCYDNGVQKLWVLNVGSLKPLEIETDFFLDLAWTIGTAQETDPIHFMEQWMERNFHVDKKDAADAALIYAKYAQLTNMRKLEFMEENLFSHSAFGNEGARRMTQYLRLFEQTNAICRRLPAQKRDSFFQLFAMKIHAAFWVNASFYFADHSTWHYLHGRMREADLCVEKSLLADDLKRQMIYFYNKIMNDGKWNHMLTPESYPPPCTALYPEGTPALVIPKKTPASIEPNDGVLSTEAVPEAAMRLPETAGQETGGFAEEDGYISIEAAHFIRNEGWSEIPYLGRGEGSCMQANRENAELTYEFTLADKGEILLELFRFPTLCQNGKIRAQITVDDTPPIIMEAGFADEKQGDWQDCVYNWVEKMYLTLLFPKPGYHTLRVRACDRYFTFSKMVLYTHGFLPSNAGPPESRHALWNPSPDREAYRFEPDMQRLADNMETMYRCTLNDVPARELLYADRSMWAEHWLYMKPHKRPQQYGRKKYIRDPAGCKDIFRHFGQGVFYEKNGVIAFGAEYALEHSPNADCHGQWTHLNSESDARTGIALKAQSDDAHLSYRIRTSGGTYAVWALLKYRDGIPKVSLSADGIQIPDSDMVHNGKYHHGSTQQQWAWTLLTQLPLDRGIHQLSLSPSKNLCIDRIYLSQNEQWPPTDREWRESARIKEENNY